MDTKFYRERHGNRSCPPGVEIDELESRRRVKLLLTFSRSSFLPVARWQAVEEDGLPALCFSEVRCAGLLPVLTL
jgi:hypothetical protein